MKILPRLERIFCPGFGQECVMLLKGSCSHAKCISDAGRVCVKERQFRIRLPMPILVKAMNQFPRIKKKMGPATYLEMEKQNAITIVEEEVLAPALKKVPVQKGNGRVLRY